MAHGRLKPNKLRPRRIDVLWKTNPELVLEEISKLQENGINKPNFELRTAASKRIIANMSREDLKTLDLAVTDWQQNGYPEEHKRRSVYISGPAPVPNPKYIRNVVLT